MTYYQIQIAKITDTNPILVEAWMTNEQIHVDHVELWYDSDYTYKWTVSLCAEDGGEIGCVGAHSDRRAAIQAAEKSAREYGVRGFERRPDGWVSL